MGDIQSERKQVAFEAVKNALGTKAGKDSVDLFVEHHLEALPSSYWQTYLGTDAPEAQAVIGLLELCSSWGADDVEYFDFTLPGEVTDYVISVHFDGDSIDEITMES